MTKTKQATPYQKPYHDSWFFCNFTAADSHCQFNTKEEAEGMEKLRIIKVLVFTFDVTQSLDKHLMHVGFYCRLQEAAWKEQKPELHLITFSELLPKMKSVLCILQGMKKTTARPKVCAENMLCCICKNMLWKCTKGGFGHLFSI